MIVVVALLGGDVDALEVAERGDAPLAALQLGLAEEVLLGDLHLAADDAVAGLGVAADLDPAVFHRLATLDRHDDVDLLLLGIELRRRRGLDVGVARVAVHRLDGAEVLHQLGAVEEVAGLGADHVAQVAAPVERLDLFAVLVLLEDAELADLVARALGDREGDLDAVAVRRQHHPRGRDLDREEALVVVERVDDEHVALERVLPERAAGAEVEEGVLLAGDHHLAQLGVADVDVAHEGDPPHAHLLVLAQGEFDDDLVVLLRDDLV